MTTFEDGPAKGQTLMLHRAPIFLRVVQDAKGKWDALDQLDDKPRLDETLYAYQLKEQPGHCHIRASGGRGGFYPMATYVFLTEQPRHEDMFITQAWIEWVHANAHKAIVQPKGEQ